MDRTYKLKHLAKKGKGAKVIQTVQAYRDTADIIAREQWRCFYEKSQSFNRRCDIKHIDTPLSERFKQTCQYKVVGTLDSLYKQQTERFCLSCPSQHP
jgi:putative transposase